jgi:hypothetical protein
LVEIPSWIPVAVSLAFLVANLGLLIWTRRSATAASSAAESARQHVDEAKRSADAAEKAAEAAKQHVIEAKRSADATEVAAAAATVTTQVTLAREEQDWVDRITAKLSRPDDVKALLADLPAQLVEKRCELLRRAVNQSKERAHYNATGYLPRFFPEWEPKTAK